jgi:HEAT repeat protein
MHLSFRSSVSPGVRPSVCLSGSAARRRSGSRTRRSGPLAIALLAALALLASCGGESLPGKTPDEKTRAAANLARRDADDGIPVLLRAAQTEPEMVQVEAISALGRIGTDKAVAALAKLSTHESRTLRITVAQALSDVKDESYPAAARVLVGMGTAALPEGPGKDPHRDVRRAVTTALAVARDKEGLDFLLERALKDPDENIRNASVKTLGRLKDPRPVDALTEIYRTDNEKNSAWAIEALGTIGDPRAVPVIKEALSNPDRVTRGKAAWSLLQIEGPQAAPDLREALQREEDEMPAVVMAHALATLGDKEAVHTLETFLLLAKNDFARAEAGRALAAVGTCESFKAVDKAFREDRDGLVKREAAAAARKLLDRCPGVLKTLEGAKAEKP